MLQPAILLILHLALLRVATDLPMKNFSLDVRVMERGGGGARMGWRHSGGWRRDVAQRRGEGRSATSRRGGALVFLCRIGALISVVYSMRLDAPVTPNPVTPNRMARGASGHVLTLDVLALVASKVLSLSAPLSLEP
jgi:hypothetical protein